MTTESARRTRPPLVLRAVMWCDSAGSFGFIPVTLGAPAVIALAHPHGALLAAIWWVLSCYGLLLGLLGVAMAFGLSRVMLRGEGIPADWYLSLLGCRSRR
jgi:hypothetical protein